MKRIQFEMISLKGFKAPGAPRPLAVGLRVRGFRLSFLQLLLPALLQRLQQGLPQAPAGLLREALETLQIIQESLDILKKS